MFGGSTLHVKGGEFSLHELAFRVHTRERQTRVSEAVTSEGFGPLAAVALDPALGQCRGKRQGFFKPEQGVLVGVGKEGLLEVHLRTHEVAPWVATDSLFTGTQGGA